MRLGIVILGLQIGCLGPLASDGVGASGAILPPGTSVPALADDPVALARLAMNDGVDDVVTLQSAFADGVPVHVWDFGPAPAFAAPLFAVVERDPTGALVRIDHPTVIAALPGDPGYSPFWAVLFVEVTERYAGEILPSFAAVDEAIAAGLVMPPVLQAFAVNCPAVAPDVRIAVGAGVTMPPNATFYYEAKTVPYFDFGPMPLVDRAVVPEQRRYELRREGGEPLSEIVRNVDMTGDGDANDTNDIYSRRPGLATSTPLVRTVTVAVPAATSSIDDSSDETLAELVTATQLFDPAPTPNVIGYQVTEQVHNRPGQQRAGAL
jgi:hypothetical protein